MFIKSFYLLRLEIARKLKSNSECQGFMILHVFSMPTKKVSLLAPPHKCTYSMKKHFVPPLQRNLPLTAKRRRRNPRRRL